MNETLHNQSLHLLFVDVTVAVAVARSLYDDLFVWLYFVRAVLSAVMTAMLRENRSRLVLVGGNAGGAECRRLVVFAHNWLVVRLLVSPSWESGYLPLFSPRQRLSFCLSVPVSVCLFVYLGACVSVCSFRKIHQQLFPTVT